MHAHCAVEFAGQWRVLMEDEGVVGRGRGRGGMESGGRHDDGTRTDPDRRARPAGQRGPALGHPGLLSVLGSLWSKVAWFDSRGRFDSAGTRCQCC